MIRYLIRKTKEFHRLEPFAFSNVKDYDVLNRKALRIMKKKKRTIAILVVLTVIVLAVVLKVTSNREKPLRVNIEKVSRTDLTSVVSASGEIKPKKSVDISAHLPGRIVKIGVKEGQEVRTGDFLLKLDSTQYEANAERDRASIQAFNAELIKADVALQKDKSFYERQKNLFDNGLISKEQLEQAKTQLDISDASHRAVRYQIEQAQAALKSTLDNLSKTVFSSPIDGIITSLRVEEGEVAIIGTMNNPGTVLLSIADLSIMEAEVEVDETDVVSVRMGQAADVHVDAFPDRVFKGKVTEVGSSALVKTTAQTAQESKDFKVVITLDDPSKLLKPGLSASADIITAQKKQVLAVPISALVLKDVEAASGGTVEPLKSRTNTEEEGVYVVENERTKFVPVRKGIMGELMIEVVSGLTEGQEIVAGPYEALRQIKDGTLVKADVKKEEARK
jgi:HlyD family secretion protein